MVYVYGFTIAFLAGFGIWRYSIGDRKTPIVAVIGIVYNVAHMAHYL